MVVKEFGGAVVQWLEYLPVTQGVAGSSPVRSALIKKPRVNARGFFSSVYLLFQNRKIPLHFTLFFLNSLKPKSPQLTKIALKEAYYGYPCIGLGTFRLKDDVVISSVKTALNLVIAQLILHKSMITKPQ